ASLFVPASVLLQQIGAVSTIPPRVASRIRACLEKPIRRDAYTWFFDHLHGDRYPWTHDLGARLAAHQQRIVFRRGEGYLIHDRAWLHGREPALGGVSAKRVHRLVFTPAE